MTTAAIALVCILLLVTAAMARALIRAHRDRFIRLYMFPNGLLTSLGKRRPELVLKDQQLVAHALRQFFLTYLRSGRRPVAMPSQVVDDLWHEFILYTRNYEQFCGRAFGRLLHHTPAAVLSRERDRNAALRRVWYYACLEENINPRTPTRLPLLFALDRKFAIAGGFLYVLDCNTVVREGAQGHTAIHCGSDFSSTSFDGSTDGLGDAGSGGSSGDGGDGGGGCSGGCGSS